MYVITRTIINLGEVKGETAAIVVQQTASLIVSQEGYSLKLKLQWKWSIRSIMKKTRIAPADWQSYVKRKEYGWRKLNRVLIVSCVYIKGLIAGELFKYQRRENEASVMEEEKRGRPALH